ncbi:MAG: hypothetical protein KatS3mg077_2898 [Candidatus Binatia bacterium]|nr:MAG: hypothetical protein KatS3mg077_2898 [Candidatus Binatia bacterium]
MMSSTIPGLRSGLRCHWWALPVVVLLLDLICLRSHRLDPRLHVALAHFVSLRPLVKERLETEVSTQEKFSMAIHRMQRAAFSLSRLRVVVVVMTVAFALLGVFLTEVAWWVRVVTLINGFYCAVCRLLAAPLH